MAIRSPAGAVNARPRLSRDFITEHRRRRYVEATAEILHEFGRRGVTTTNVVRVAGGSRKSFYDSFTGIEDCIAYGISLAEAELFAGIGAQRGGGDWLIEVQGVIAGFYEAVATRPLIAELFLIHAAVSPTEAGAAAFRTGGERFVGLLRRGRAEAQSLGRRPPSTTIEECLSRAIVALAAERVGGPEVERLPSEARPMAILAGGYYLGRQAGEGRGNESSSRASLSPR
jgi:AcrR family transcriptional regulator